MRSLRRSSAPLLRAPALHADGAVALAEGDPRRALGVLRSAWVLWQELDAPYDGARVRVLIGQACRELGDEDTAEMELDAARWVFEELGAAPDLARAQKLSRRKPALTARRAVAARGPGAAAGRRRQDQPGDRRRAVSVSEKTVHRHLSNIFTKIDVGSRAAATAYAFQHKLV